MGTIFSVNNQLSPVERARTRQIESQANGWFICLDKVIDNNTEIQELLDELPFLEKPVLELICQKLDDKCSSLAQPEAVLRYKRVNECIKEYLKSPKLDVASTTSSP